MKGRGQIRQNPAYRCVRWAPREGRYISRAAEIFSGKLRFALLALPICISDFSPFPSELKRLGLIVCQDKCNEKYRAGKGIPSPTAATLANASEQFRNSRRSSHRGAAFRTDDAFCGFLVTRQAACCFVWLTSKTEKRKAGEETIFTGVPQ